VLFNHQSVIAIVPGCNEFPANQILFESCVHLIYKS